MYKQCKTVKSAKRQREIAKSMVALMASTPYDDITVTALCEYLDMPRKSFYRYFDAKEDVLNAFMDNLLSECDTIILSAAPLRQRVEHLLLFVKRQKELLDIFEKNNVLDALVKRACDRGIDNADALAPLLVGEPQWARPMIARFATAGFATIALDWYKDDFARPVGEMTDICCRMLARPLLDTLPR